MAEIEIGTLNSPEISLFLNASNNLELQDSDGNVIATFKQDQSSEFSSVNTDSATIGSGDQISQIEFGAESITYPSAASDDGWDSRQTVTTSVSFSTNFSSTPSVVLGGRAVGGINIGYFNNSSSGFDIEVSNYSTTDQSGRTENVYWVAID